MVHVWSIALFASLWLILAALAYLTWKTLRRVEQRHRDKGDVITGL